MNAFLPAAFFLTRLLLAQDPTGQVPETAAESATQPAPQEQALTPLLREPELLDFFQAPYPDEARSQGIEGTVRLLIEIDETGSVSSVEILEGAGWGFDEAASEAASHFRFSPAEDERGPVPVLIEFEYGFQLAPDEVPADTDNSTDTAALEPVNLDGRLLEMGTRRPLEHFPVLLDDLPEIQTETDSDGCFSFRGLSPGHHELRIVYPGFVALEKELEIQEGERLSLKLWMRNKSYGDDEIVGVYRRDREEVTRYTLDINQVRRVPGTFGDPIRVIQTLPGAARSPFGTGLLIIRGANPEDSAVYVDGIRIPLIYHLGGIVSVLNADLVESVDYLPGAYGVQYGRSMGGVIDVHTKTTYPEQRRLVWSTDILDSGGLVEGRAGKNDGWGFAAAGRRSYIDLFIPLFTGDSGMFIKPRWLDYQLKLDRLDMDAGKLNLFLFGFDDILQVSTPADQAQGTDQDTQGDLATRYGTHRFTLNWERPLGRDLTLRLAPSLGLDIGELGFGSDMNIDTRDWMLEIRAELPWKPSPAFSLTPGIDLIASYYFFDVGFPMDPAYFWEEDPLAEREEWNLEDHGLGLGPDLYLVSELRPLADPERLLITPGLRLNYTALQNGYSALSLDPRISTRWSLLDDAVVKASLGLYHQPPQPFEMYRPDGNVDLGYEVARSATVGWEYESEPALSLQMEIFYKHLEHLLIPNWEITSWDDPFFKDNGVGRVYGMEFLLKREQVDDLYGWLSYTLSRSMRNDDPQGDGYWYPFELDQTHILVLVAGYSLPRDFEVSTKVQYVTGNPTTPYAGGVYDVDQGFYWPYQTAQYDSERLPPYWSVDLRLEKLFTFRRWQMRAYIDALNLLHGENPEYVTYNYDYTESAYVHGLPLIINPGLDFEIRF